MDEGRNEKLAPQDRKPNSAYVQNPHLSVHRKILADFLYFNHTGRMTLAHKAQNTALGSG